jgi:hypothetical protein
MGIVIQPLANESGAAVREFNARLRARGWGEFAFPEAPEPGRQEFLVVDNGCVRGGYILRGQDFCIDGSRERVAHYRLPVSEGLIDKAYVGVGAVMLRHALAQQPLLYALGMGGVDRPLPRMLESMGWRLHPVGFYFQVLRPARFLRNIRPLRRTPWRRAALDLAAASGAGWVAMEALQLARYSAGPDTGVTLETAPDFGSWTDEVWDACHARYAAIGVRDRGTLNRLYPAADGRFLISKAIRGGRVVGWTVGLDTAMRDDKYFGDLRVGSIVDGLAKPEDARAVVAASARALAARGVDLIVSNQCHRAWGEALRHSGFLQGPSNFIFAVSKKLAGVIGQMDDVHINRGDGDGPIHL